MTATTASIEVRDYLAAVSRELADLPADERDDLLEDLDSHLHEVIAEGEGSLEQRLGPPAQYAAELRASAGLSSSDRSTANALHRVVSSLSASSIWRRTAEHPWTRATLAFLPQLRPAWWIVRAWLAVGIIAGVYRQRGFNDASITDIYHDSGLWPGGYGHRYIGIALLVIAMPISIQLGRRSLRGSARWLVVAGNVIAVALLWPALSGLNNQTYIVDSGQSVPTDGLYNNGNQVTNIYPYDAQGQPLDHVRLFDQDGEPLLRVNDVPAIAVDGVPVATPAPSAYANEYPQPNTTTIYGPDGQPTTAVLPRPNIVVPPLPSASATPPSPSP
ncbi:MAG TPA: hypothetical protein VGD55_05625, partial [Acidothermaceae bacterium]